MNIDNFEMLLVGKLDSIVGLILFIYLGNLILDFLKIPAWKTTQLKRRVSNTEASNSVKERRRIESKPGIICSLPIHQQKRQDAPLF